MSTPKPFSIDDLAAVIAPAKLVDLAMNWVNYPAFLADVNAQNRAHVAHWADALAASGKIDAAERATVQDVLDALDEPEPEKPAPIVHRRSPDGTPGAHSILPPNEAAPRAAGVGRLDAWRVLFDDKVPDDAPPEGFKTEDEAKAWVEQWFIDWYAKNPVIVTEEKP